VLHAACLAVTVLLQSQGAPQAAGFDSLGQDRVVGLEGQRLDSALTGFECDGFWGAVLVAPPRPGRAAAGYGLADAARGIRNHAATRFEMNSITKTFTAAGILQLAGAGSLAVTDRLERHLGPFAPDKRDATIDQLIVVWAANNLERRWRDTLNRVIPAIVFGAQTAR
jgi:hypothetical protein